MTKFPLLALAAALLVIGAQPAFAQTQNGPGWFIPAQPAPAPKPAPLPAPAPAQAAQPAPPPIPQLPPLPPGNTPPAAIIGVLSVPDVMRDSTAAQIVEKEIAARRRALSAAAHDEEAVWRQMQQAINRDRPHLTATEFHQREQELQNRITKAQQEFRQRNLEIEQATQVAVGEIERMLIAVIRQVAESRTINLVLHRAQVALNISAFDITQEVTDQLNKLLPKVTVPPDSAMPAARSPAAALADVPPGASN